MGTGSQRFRSTSSGGGSGITQAQLNAALSSRATTAALQTVANAAVTDTELAAVQTALQEDIDKTLTSVARQADQSLLLTYSDNTTRTVAPSSLSAINIVDNDAAYQALPDKTGWIAW